MSAPNHLIRFSILAAVLSIVALLGGCFMLSPGDGDQNAIDLQFVVRTDDAGGGSGQSKVPTPGSPSQILADANEEIGELSARAVLKRLGPGETDPALAEIVTTAPLTVSAFDPADGSRSLEGIVEFDFGPAGSSYLVDVELSYLEREDPIDLLGEYRGRVDFDFGLSVEIPSLVIDSRQGSSNQYEGQVTLAHPDFDPVTEDVFPRFDPEMVGMRLQYTTEEAIDFFENGDPQRIVVAMEAGFEPTTIYAARNVALGEIGVGSVTLATDVVELQEVGPSVDLNRFLEGAITVVRENSSLPRANGVVHLEAVRLRKAR